MAVMVVMEKSRDGSREFELNRENVLRLEKLTGMDYVAIYTTLNSGQAIERDGTEWRMLKQ